MTVKIIRDDLTAQDLRAASGGAKDGRVARRLLAIAFVLEGVSRKTAAESCGMDRQTLRDWVHRYNAQGIAGLSNRCGGGAQPRLTSEQMAQLASWVEAGPDLARDGVVRWRRADLARRIEKVFSIDLHERTVGKYLDRLGFRRLSVRPEHPNADPGGAGSVQKNFQSMVTDILPTQAKDKPLEVWFQEEARVGQQGTLTRIWSRRGTRPRAPRDTRYKWSYTFGTGCPARGTAAGLVLPYVGTEAMNLHLVEIAKTVAQGAHALLLIDGAGWHVAKALKVPDNITLLKLPPYAPELNPMENVWQYLRANKLAITVFDSYEDILDKCADAWNFFATEPERLTSITQRE